MADRDLLKLIALAKSDPRFVKGKLGEEYLKTLRSKDSQKLGRLVIVSAKGPAGGGRRTPKKVKAIMQLAGRSPRLA